MALPIFDFHEDVRNFFITPEMRGRFYRMAPGQVDSRHSHDLGHEIFFVLEGQCEMEIEGERAVLGPGQACIARRDQMHQAKTVGDQPMTMYLSVCPHIVPTHTHWTADPKEGGQKLPPRYMSIRGGTEGQKPSQSIPELVDRQVKLMQTVAGLAQASASTHERAGEGLKGAVASGDEAAARGAVDAMWGQLYPLLRAISDLTEVWNELAPRAAALT